MAGKQEVQILGPSENEVAQDTLDLGEDGMQRSDGVHRGSANADLGTVTDIVRIVGGILMSA